MYVNDILYEDLIELLAIVYMNIPWHKIKTSKNAYDIFNHRVRAAARRGTINEFISKLCNYFSLQSLPLETQELIERLRPYEREVLSRLEREHIAFSVYAIARAKELKKKNKEKEGSVND